MNSKCLYLDIIEVQNKEEFFFSFNKEDIIFGEECEYDIKYYLVRNKFITEEGKEFKVGIISENLLDPVCILIDETQKLFIGYDNVISIIDVKKGKVLNNLSNIIFYDFLPIEDNECVICMFEIAVLSLDFNGNCLWRVELPDIASSWNLENNILNINLFEGELIKINILDGIVN